MRVGEGARPPPLWKRVWLEEGRAGGGEDEASGGGEDCGCPGLGTFMSPRVLLLLGEGTGMKEKTI